MNTHGEPAGHRAPIAGLENTVVLVTGASGGVGGGIATAFARCGATVIAHYHHGRERAEALADTLTAQGGTVRAVGADLSDAEARHTLFEQVLQDFGRLDTLVNNAGIQPLEPLASMSVESFRTMLDTNLTTVFACTQQAAALMVPAGGGSIIHIASIEGSQPAPGHAHYCAAKAGVIMHARAAALEYGPRGVRVNTVSPGLIDSGQLEQSWPEGWERWHAAAPLGRVGDPLDIGWACAFLASPQASWITGTDLVVDGGISAHPTW